MIYLLVRLGVCVPELNTSKCTTLEENVYKRLDFNIRKAEMFKSLGFTHIRFNNILGSGFSRSDMSSVLESSRIQSLSPWLVNAGYTTSIHAPYKYNFFTVNSTRKALNYINDLGSLLDVLHMNTCAINMHVKCNQNQSDMFYHKFVRKLDYNTRSRLVFENDDRILNVKNTLDIALKSKVGFVYDNLHDRLNKSDGDLVDYINDIKSSWNFQNTKAFMHYSNGTIKGHNSVFDIEEFINILLVYKKYFSEVVVIIELKDYLNSIEKFRYNTCNKLGWLDNYRFII